MFSSFLISWPTVLKTFKMAAANVSRFHEFTRKIVGVGFNYKSLMQEMGASPTKTPRLYLKAPSSIVTQGDKIVIPKFSTDGVLYEVELGVIIGDRLKDVPPSKALDGVAGYCTALDFTCKANLFKAFDKKLSWAVAKCFDTACGIGSFQPAAKVGDPSSLNLWLKQNGELRQDGNTNDMTWPVADLVSIMSGFFTLEPGDFLLTGTPAGIGTINSGDVIEAGVERLESVRFEVV